MAKRKEPLDPFARDILAFKTGLPSLFTAIADRVAAIEPSSAFHACYHALITRFEDEYRQPDLYGLFPHIHTQTPHLSRANLIEFIAQQMVLEPFLHLLFPVSIQQNTISIAIKQVVTTTITDRASLVQQIETHTRTLHVHLEQVNGTERQRRFIAICEAFLQSYDSRRADVLGIVYTPPEIVDFMCNSVEEQIRAQYGLSLSAEDVPILDPCTGVGPFLINILWRIDDADLERKYVHELFGIEILLLPYYLATLGIEQAYVERTGRYRAFPGMRYADTLLA